MKSKDLLDAMNGIDPDILEDAELPIRKSRKARVFPRLSRIATAASFALVAAILLITVPHLKNTWTPLPGGENEHNTDLEGGSKETVPSIDHGTLPDYSYVTVPLWPFFGPEVTYEVTEALLASIEEAGYDSYVSARVIGENCVGESLGTVTVRTYWHNFSEKVDTEVEYRTAELFCIKGVDADFAICLRYLDGGKHYTTTHYYAWLNTVPEISDLSALYRALGASEHLSVRENAVLVGQTGKDARSYTLEKSPLARFRTLLLSKNGDGSILTKELGDTILQNTTVWARVYLDLPDAGTVGTPAAITDNGYFLISFGGNSYAFEIGESAASELLNLIAEEGVCKTAPSEDVVTAETSSD